MYASHIIPRSSLTLMFNINLALVQEQNAVEEEATLTKFTVCWIKKKCDVCLSYYSTFLSNIDVQH